MKTPEQLAEEYINERFPITEDNEGIFISSLYPHELREYIEQAILFGYKARGEREDSKLKNIQERCEWYSQVFQGPEHEWRHFLGVEIQADIQAIREEE